MFKKIFRVSLFATLTIVFTFVGFTLRAESDNYVAYSVNEEGNQSPLPKEIDPIDAEHFFNVEWGQYDGFKQRLAILPARNKTKHSSVSIKDEQSGNIQVESYAKGVPVSEIEGMFTDIIHRTNRFRVIERSRIESVLKEQDFGKSDRVSDASAAKMGKILGVELLMKPVVTSYEPRVEAQKFGIGALVDSSLLGGFSVSSSKSIVGMNFRIMNANTGEIEFTDQVKVKITKSGFGVSGAGFDGGDAAAGSFSTASKTPIGQAIIAALNKGAFSLVKHVGAQPAEGSVVKAQAGKIYTNLGSDAVEKGETLKLISLGEKLTDPETGLSLGRSQTEVGEISIANVNEKFSIANPVDFSLQEKDVTKGDKIVSQQTPNLNYAEEFTPPR